MELRASAGLEVLYPAISSGEELHASPSFRSIQSIGQPLAQLFG
jgi:hypothetical protein